MKGAVAKSEEVAAERPGAVLARQFANEANPEIHRQTTAEEIESATLDMTVLAEVDAEALRAALQPMACGVWWERRLPPTPAC